MLKNAGLDGYFTNHSLHRTCATRLFQAGQDVKLVKEITGHVSDAVHKYQNTSDEQQMRASNIIQQGVENIKLSEAEPMVLVSEPSKVSNCEKFKLPKLKLPVGNSENIEKDEAKETCMSNVSEMIEFAIRAVGNRKAKLTFQVELLD